MRMVKATNKNWISSALPKSSKGKLHKALHVKQGEKISEAKLDKASKSKSPVLRKEVALAKTLSKLRKK